MEPELEQQNMDMTPDEAAASLAFATNMSEMMMPQDPTAEGQTEEAPETPADLDTKIESIIDHKLAEFQQKLLGDLETLDDEQEDTKKTDS